MRQVTLEIPRAPTPLTQIAGNLRFNGSEIRLDQVKARYGTVPFQAMGSLDTRTGFNLKAQVPAVDLSAVVKTLNLTLPFAATGKVVADLNLTGALTQPRLTGTARTTKVSTLDRVALSRVSTQFEFDPQAMLVRFPRIAATPAAGGKVIGSGPGATGYGATRRSAPTGI